MARILASNVDFYSLNSSTEGLKRYGYYKCTLTCDEPIRSGKKIIIPKLKVVMTRQGTGYVEYRLAARAGIGGSQSNICSNKTINTYGTNSPKTITVDLGSPSIETLSTSVSLYVSLASTGGSSSWGNFKGKSPHVIFNGTVKNCPPANPTFTTAPSFSNIYEDNFKLNFGVRDIASKIYYRESTDSDWTAFTATDNALTFIGRTPGSAYHFQVKAVSDFDTTMETIYPSETEWMTVNTYSFPYVTRAQLAGLEHNNITLQLNKEEIYLYNPLKRPATIKLYSVDNNGTETEISSYPNITGTKYEFSFPISNAAAAMDKTATSHNKYRYKCIYNHKVLTYTYDETTQSWITGEEVQVKTSTFNPTNMSFTLNEDYCKPRWPQDASDILFKLISFEGDNTNIYINNENRVDNSEEKYKSLDTIAGNLMVQNYSKIICKLNTAAPEFSSLPQYSSYLSKFKVCFDLNTEDQIWYDYDIQIGTWTTTPLINNQLEIITATIRAVDSRGFISNPISYNIKTIPYEVPKGLLEAGRLDGFGTIVSATLTPSWFLNNVDNQGWFVYNIVGSDGQKIENIIQPINNTDIEGILKTELPLMQLEIDFKTESSFDIVGRLIDALGGESEPIQATISSGTPIFFIDTITQGVGANMYPNGKGYWGHEAHIDNITTQIVTLLTSNGNIEISADLLAQLKTLVAFNYFLIGNENGLYIKDSANHTFSSYTANGNEQFNMGLKEQLKYGENGGSYNIIGETITGTEIGYGHFWNGG